MEKSAKIPLSLVILAITGLAYVVSFAFQYAFLNTFGISYKVIDISVPSLILSIGLTALVAFNVDHILSAFRSLLSKRKSDSPIQRLGRKYIAVLIVFGFSCMAFYGLNILHYAWALVLLFVWLAIVWDFGSIFIKSLQQKSFSRGANEHFKKMDKSAKKSSKHDHQGYLERYSDYVVWMVLLIVFALCAGRLFASMQGGYYVLDSNGDIKTIMIQKSGDILITKQYNEAEDKLLPGFTLQKMNEPILFNERVKFKVDNL